MFYLDTKYLNLVSSKLEGFTQKKSDLWTCRCCYCGDSAKKKSKKRGFFYKKADNLFFRCFNCEVSTTFYKVLEYLDPTLAKEYSLERFASGSSKHGNYKKPKTIEFKKPVFKKKTTLNIPALNVLPDDNIAKKYALDRKIPKGQFKDLYYAEDFKKFVKEIYPAYDKELIDNDPRLIIPFRNENGDLFAFQGRALNKNPLRYITIKLDDESQKIFGLDRINKKETIYVTEGPIDSLFIKNAVATADSNLTVAEFLGKEKLVLIFDNEPRNTSIVKQIKKAIDKGFKVCLFPNEFQGKDINEAVLNGFTKPQVQRIINENTVQGLQATLEFNNWKKC
jgi:hypothetical protein